MKKTYFPPEFVEKYSKMLGDEKEAFFSACATKEPKSFWCNSLRVAPEELKTMLESQGWELGQLGFHGNALEMLEGPDRPGQSEEFGRGLFNIQEKAAMLPVIALDPKPGERVLDAFAAPGNKTLQIACLTGNHPQITALEREPSRLRALEFNIAKFGFDALARKLDFQKFKDDAGFDKILLDAPCSSEGLVRKRLDGLKGWSPKKVANMAKRQKKAAVKGYDLLKPGGTLVYSTCSLSPEEDEEAIGHLLSQRPEAAVLPISIGGVKPSPGITEYEGKEFSQELKKCWRLYPHVWDCQPFFLAKAMKP